MNNFNLIINEGESIAFCGPSGGGKSTLVKILLRFYDYQEGEILLDGNNIRTFNGLYLRKNIGLVLQEPCLFSGTIEQNITFGVDEYTKEELYHAAEIANALEFILDKYIRYKFLLNLINILKILKNLKINIF